MLLVANLLNQNHYLLSSIKLFFVPLLTLSINSKIIIHALRRIKLDLLSAKGSTL